MYLRLFTYSDMSSLQNRIRTIKRTGPVQSASTEPLHLTCSIYLYQYTDIIQTIDNTCSPAEMCNMSHWAQTEEHIITLWGVGLHNQTLVSAVDWTVDDDICHRHSEKQSKPGVTRISDKMKTRQEVEGTHCLIKPNETYTTVLLMMVTKLQQSSACFIGTQVPLQMGYASI